MQKQYIIKRYILAENALEALALEKNQPADECWIDEDWKKENPCFILPKTNKIGFSRKK